eukprot:gene28699-31863_t
MAISRECTLMRPPNDMASLPGYWRGPRRPRHPGTREARPALAGAHGNQGSGTSTGSRHQGARARHQMAGPAPGHPGRIMQHQTGIYLASCCSGRIVSVLEGGYNLRGGIVSAFARSVAAHVRALVDDHGQEWDPADAQMAREQEAKRREAVRAAAALRKSTLSLPVEAAPVGEAKAADEGGAAPPTSAPAPASGPAAPAATAASGPSPADADEVEPSSKRSRRGGGVDYAALNATMEEEKKKAAAAASASNQ